jgi:hypothetical protein
MNREEIGCTLSDKELTEKVQEWVSKLCKSGGKAWTLHVPVSFNTDPDMLITELCKRYETAQSTMYTEEQLKIAF